MELFCYVNYIQEERVKIQIFLGVIPSNYRDQIEFAYPHMLEASIRMDTHHYEQGKGKDEVCPSWKEKPEGRFKPRMREFQHTHASNYLEHVWKPQ